MKATSYLSKHGTYLEEKVVKEADIVTGTSSQIVDDFKALGIQIEYLPNAANVDHFKKIYFSDSKKPKVFGPSAKKVIGYIGSIDFRTNFKILKKLAINNQEKLIMLMGPVRPVPNNENIDSFPNVIFTGNIPMTELPHYAKFLDCAIIPFVSNEFTKSVYPLKINEYLACGRPVVTTRFSNEMDSFKEIAYVTNDEDEFVSLVEKAIMENSKQKELERIRFSEDNSWTKRIEQFWEIITSYSEDKLNKISSQSETKMQ
jgi:glycosyltransferase involved in cell wall biosynthesis